MRIRNSIMFRMMLLLFVAAIPLYAVGIGLYSASGQQVVREMLDTKQSQMEYYLKSVEDELERLSMLEATVINKSAVGSLANRYDYFSIYERGNRINTLRDNLVNLRMSSAYAETVTVYLMPIHKKLNDYTGLDPINDEDYALALALSDNIGSLICMEGGELYATVSVRNGAQEPVYTMAAKLSRTRLHEDLARLESSVPSETVMVYAGRSVLTASSAAAGSLWLEGCARMRCLTESGVEKLSLNGENYYVTSIYSPFMQVTLLNFTRERDLMTVSAQYMPYLLGLTAAAAVLIFVLAHGTNWLVHRPLHRLMDAFRQIREGDMTVRIEHHGRDEFRDVYQSFNQMAEMLDAYINRSLKQELLLRKSEILQLQAQINPHFLYNSYFMLRRMVKGHDWQNAELFSGYMGEYFRYITRNAEQLVPLEKEAEHARIYTEIQEMRFGGRIQVDFGEVPEHLRQIPTPRLILQPVLENAFEHGLKDTVENGLVRVRFWEEAGKCVIAVEDNGDALSDVDLERLIESMEDSSGETTALRNISHRLRLRASDGLGFALLRSPLGGLCVRMVLCDEVKQNESADC